MSSPQCRRSCSWRGWGWMGSFPGLRGCVCLRSAPHLPGDPPSLRGGAGPGGAEPHLHGRRQPPARGHLEAERPGRAERGRGAGERGDAQRPPGGTLGSGGKSQGAQRRSPRGWRASPGHGATVLRASVATGDVAGEERDAEHRRGGARQRGHLHVPCFQQGGHHHPHHPRARAG